MESLLVLGSAWLAGAAVFAGLGWWVASQKGREGIQGAALGFMFGPVGCIVLALLPNGSQGPKRDEDSHADAPDLPWLNEFGGPRKPATPEEAWLKELENRHRPKP